MLVAVPSAIAFGVSIFAPLGGSFAAQGAIAGVLGAVALGLVAASFGGTNRLITAPCAPAAAVLSAFAIQQSQQGTDPTGILLQLALIGLLCGVIQLAFGFVGLGRLIKYMPYPVVSGYLSGVGLIIIASQVPKLLGAPRGMHFWESLGATTLWKPQGIAVGVLTAVAMTLAPRLTRRIPAPIVGLAAGLLAYAFIAAATPALRTLEDNPYVIGPLVTSGAGFLSMLGGRWSAIGQVDFAAVAAVLVPALTLAVLLSIDTLKTCVVLDALTRSRHDSNRELIGQGLGNLASAVVGGVPGAGTMGATLVAISGGAQTRRSGMIEGALCLVAFLILGGLIAWIPIAALSGILIVIGVRMIDRNSLHLLQSRSTLLDFGVIAGVVVVALTVSLIAASAVGVGLAILLFVREQIGGSVVRRIVHGNQTFSKQVRLPEEMQVLQRVGDRTAILELQGSLFFGTTDQLYRALEPEIQSRDFVILDMRRVQGVDFTAQHMLEQVESQLADRGATLLVSHPPRRNGRPAGSNGGWPGLGGAHAFAELDDALEWVEDHILADHHMNRAAEDAMALREIELFRCCSTETLAEFEACMERSSYPAGATIFARGSGGDELYLIRRGVVRIVLPVEEGAAHHLASFGRGDFFGEMAFLDGERRSADAVAFSDVDLFSLSRARFDAFAEGHRKTSSQLLEAIARALAIRLRYTNAELRSLEAS